MNVLMLDWILQRGTRQRESKKKKGEGKGEWKRRPDKKKKRTEQYYFNIHLKNRRRDTCIKKI